MPRNRTRLSVFLILLSLFATGCSQSIDPAATAVEKYLTALVEKKQESLAALSCADWEPNAQLEFDSFQAVNTRLENMSCSSKVAGDSAWLVNCTGSIVATYNNEDQQLDLSVRTYRVINQGGNFLVCGYE